MNLDIRNFTVADDFKTISYNATLIDRGHDPSLSSSLIRSNTDNSLLSGTVSGNLTFQNPIHFENTARDYHNRLDLNNSAVKIKLDSIVLDTKKGSITADIVVDGYGLIGSAGK
ncbi:MAG: hypothetical protein WA941_02020 [Nitrososphaeraceae archaeon]